MKRYGMGSAVIDITLLVLTGGLWGIVMLARYFYNKK